MHMEKQSISDMRKINYCNFDLIDYREAWEIQQTLLDLRYQNKIPDTFLMLEHPNTYTLGKTADMKNLTGSESYLASNKIKVYNIDRGGDITYHGPGQIVGYPIINLQEWKPDTHKYLRSLEEVIIKTCAVFGIKAGREEKYTGVWIGSRKIAAIGVKVSRWITMHGFAFNVNTDLKLFEGIIPCGIENKDVTSMERELGRQLVLDTVKNILLEQFIAEFGYSDFREVSPGEITNVRLQVV